jgi:hypothetical protein
MSLNLKFLVSRTFNASKSQRRKSLFYLCYFFMFHSLYRFSWKQRIFQIPNSRRIEFPTKDSIDGEGGRENRSQTINFFYYLRSLLFPVFLYSFWLWISSSKRLTGFLFCSKKLVSITEEFFSHQKFKTSTIDFLFLFFFVLCFFWEAWGECNGRFEGVWRWFFEILVVSWRGWRCDARSKFPTPRKFFEI